MATIERAVRQGRFKFAAQVDSIGVTLDEGPAFAARAVGAFCGVPLVPVFIGLRGGIPTPLDRLEVRSLALALYALSRMEGRPGEVGEQSLEVNGERLDVVVRIPAAKTPSKRMGNKKR